jgi:arsenate reductase
MAEGLVRHHLKKKWKAYSAGTQPGGSVHPLTIKAMAEIGIDISSYRSKPVEDFRNKRFDLVITVCDDAAENCPIWLAGGRVAHISFPDPAKASATDEEKMTLFRTVRDDIHRRVFYYLSNGRSLVPRTVDNQAQE